MELALGIIVGLVILVVLVVLHELGHAIVARRNGVVVEEFGIGFPPRALGKKLKNGVLFSLNWLPLGGFVKLQGEHDSANHKGDYGAASFWQKTKILFAGVVVNWLLAIVIISVLAVSGLPKILPNQFSIPSDTQTVSKPVELGQLEPGYPAELAGLQTGDQVISIADEPIDTVDEMIAVTKEHRGQTVTVVYERRGESVAVDVALRDADGAVFGSTLGQRQEIKTTWSAPIVGIVTTGQFTWVTLQGLGQLLADVVSGLVMQLSTSETTRQQASANLERASASVAGPIGILGVIFPAAEQAGLTQLLFLTAVISLTLAVMNALPIPALDGGRWFVTALFRLLKKPLTKEREEKIQGAGFVALMGLIIVVTIGDVAKLL